MYRPSSGLSSSGRSKESGTSDSRSSRSGAFTSGSTRDRSPRHSRSPSPRGRRHRSPSCGLSSRRSPSPRRMSRERSPSGGSRRGSDQRDGSLSRRLSLGGCLQFVSRRSPCRRYESSEEHSLQPAVGDNHFGIDLLERRRESDRVGSPVDSLSDVDRSYFADSPAFSRCLSCPRSHEQYSLPEESPPNSFNRRYSKDYHSRDVYQLDFNKNYDHLQDISRELHRDGKLFRKHLYSSEERGQESKHPQYDREDRLLDINMDHQSLLPGKQNYHKRILSRSPSPRYPDEDFREFENSRSDKNTCQVTPSSGYMIPDLNNSLQSSEPQFLHTPEKAPAMPKKSILKKRVDDLSIQNFGSFLREKEYQELTSESANLRDDFLLPRERSSQYGSGISHILERIADSTSTQEKRRHSFLDDEDDSNINCPSTEKLTVNGGKESVSLNKGPLSSIPSVKPDTSEGSGIEYEKIHDLLKTFGLDIGVTEIGKGAARTQERLHWKKTLHSLDGPSHKADFSEKYSIQSQTRPSDLNQKNSWSPCGPSQPSNDISSASISEHAKSKTLEYNNSAGPPEQSFPSVSVTSSAPLSLPNLPLPPPLVSHYPLSSSSAFPTAQVLQNYPPPTMAPPSYNAYGYSSTYSDLAWPIYPPPQQSDSALPEVHGLASVTVPSHPTRSNLRVIETVSTIKENLEIKGNKSVLVEVPITLTNSRLLSQSPGSGITERISDGKNLASEKPQVIEEGEKLMSEQEAKQKKLAYLMTEFNRRCKQQRRILLRKQKARGKKKDPLLIELNRVQGNIVKEIAELQMGSRVVGMIQAHLDSLSHFSEINTLEKSVKKASENVDSSEKGKRDNKSQEKISNSVKGHLNNNPLGGKKRNLNHQPRLISIQETECGLKRKQCENQKVAKEAKVARKEESEITKELREEDDENEISKWKKGSHGQKCMIKLVLKKDNIQVEKEECEKGDSQRESRQLSSEKYSFSKTETNNHSQDQDETNNHSQDQAASKAKSVMEGKCRENKSQSGNSDSGLKVTVTKVQNLGMRSKELKTASIAKAQQQFTSFDSPCYHPLSPLSPGSPLSLVASSALDKPAAAKALGIKSTELLPVVKNSNPELVLFPNTAKAFRGRAVISKSSQEKVNLQKEVEMQLQESESVSDIVEHARVQKQEVTQADTQKYRAAEEWPMLKMVKMKQELKTSQKPHPPPFIPGPPSLLSVLPRPVLPLASTLPYPPRPLFPLAVSGPANKGHILCKTSLKPPSPLIPGPPSLMSLPLRPPLSLGPALLHPPQLLSPLDVSEPTNTGHSLCTFTASQLKRRNKRKSKRGKFWPRNIGLCDPGS